MVGGVVVYIYFDEHVPPHFHAIFAEHEAVVSIESLSVVEGKLPAAKLKKVLVWAAANQDLLRRKWAEITGK